ncbi:MAG: hypothetical protein KBE09_02120 [Candidatus Pacebacteria bacterium]|nr:hypothetical protein [Candidatus Paceibacterota bacterium]
MVDVFKRLLTLLTVVVAVGLPIAWYEGWLKPLAPVAPPPIQQLSEAERDCAVAEVYEGAAQPYDMLFLVGAIRRASSEPCVLLSQYTLLRAPSQGAASSVRYVQFIFGKIWLSEQKSRLGWARHVVELAYKSDQALYNDPRVVEVLAKVEATMAPDVQALAKRVRSCAYRVNRVWPANTAGTDYEAMKRESHPTLRFKTPSGAEFFCSSDAN